MAGAPTGSSGSIGDSPSSSSSSMRPDLVTQLEAAAFRSLVSHLQDRSDSVSNMDMMTTAGFCRNCLAKWMVLEARRIAKAAASTSSTTTTTTTTSLELSEDDLRGLNEYGYDDAAMRVYGTSYKDWKKRHQKPATPEQLERYRASAHIHSVHDESMLLRPVVAAKEDVAQAPAPPSGDAAATVAPSSSSSSPAQKPSLLSNVCCEDVEEVAGESRGNDNDSDTHLPLTKQKSLLPASHTFATPPPIPRAILIRTEPLKIAVLAASDRASRGEYPDGDLSIPAVERQVQLALGEFACLHPIMVTALVPDEADQIRAHLVRWTDEGGPDAVDLVLTTGGTGFAPRDVTPEATKAVLDAELAALMPMVLQATAINAKQPLATLSRATAGIRSQTVIANLPGNPKSIEEIMPVLFPQLLHALVDVRGW